MKIGTICAIVGGSLVLLAGIAAGVLAYGFSVIDKEEEAMNPYRHRTPPSRGY